MREGGGSILLISTFPGKLQDLTWNWLQGTHSHLPQDSLKPSVENLTYPCKGPGLPVQNKREREDYLSDTLRKFVTIPASTQISFCVAPTHLHHQAPWKEDRKHREVEELDTEATFSQLHTSLLLSHIG